MLHFLKRRSTEASAHPMDTPPPALAQPSESAAQSVISSEPPPEAKSAEQAPLMPTPMLCAEMLDCFIRTLARSGQFQRGFDTHPEFHTQMTPQELEALRHRRYLAGGVVDRTSLAVSFAGVTGRHLANLAVDIIFEDLFDLKPKWQIDDTGSASARLPFGPAKHWMLIDCVTQEVDPWLSGQPIEGAILRISLVEEA